MTSPPLPLSEELTALGAAGWRRAATAAAAMFAADVSASPPIVDPVPVVLDAEEWDQLAAGLTQRARLLDALYADLYGPRTVLSTDVAPVAEILSDPAYLRAAVGIPPRGPHRLFSLTCTVRRTAEGAWEVVSDQVDVPAGAGLAMELRRVLSRCAPTLYRSTPLRRLTPFFDAARSALHHRTRSDGRAGRSVTLSSGAQDPLVSFDQQWLANLLGAPLVSATDLRTGAGPLSLRMPGLDVEGGETVDALLRMAPSALVDPLDLGPTPLGGVTGLVEAARSGDVEILTPLGAGLLENPALRAALPDLCRQILHEDLQLRPADPERSEGAGGSGGTGGGWVGIDPTGGDELVPRPALLQLVIIAGQDGFEVLPGGVARTADSHPEALKDIWVQVPETSAPATVDGSEDTVDPREVIAAYPAMTRSIGSDLFWFGRYLERVDFTARLLRTVLDTANDLGSERSRSAGTALSVLLRSVTDVTTTYPGFEQVDHRDREAVRREIASLLSDTARPGSLAQSFVALAHTTRTLRDLISEDIWPVIARMRGRFRSLGAPGNELLEQGLTDVVDGCLTLSGAIADSMPRNLGWDLTEVGRRLERLLTLLALLRAALGLRRSRIAESRIATAVAAITESDTSYRRRYHAAVQPELLVELLLSDPTIPRSIAFQLDRLTAALDRLPELTPSPQMRAPLTALRARIGGWSAGELLHPREGTPGPQGAPSALLDETEAAIDSLRELATEIESHYFQPSESTSLWGVDDV